MGQKEIRVSICSKNHLKPPFWQLKVEESFRYHTFQKGMVTKTPSLFLLIVHILNNGLWLCIFHTLPLAPFQKTSYCISGDGIFTWWNAFQFASHPFPYTIKNLVIPERLIFWMERAVDHCSLQSVLKWQGTGSASAQ